MRVFRKVIRITAEDSPNVLAVIDAMRKGEYEPEPMLVRNEERPWGVFTQAEFSVLEANWKANVNRRTFLVAAMAIPGVLPFTEYIKRRKLWDRVRQAIGIEATFYEGSEVLLYPPQWLDRAASLAGQLKDKRRVARAIGCDPAEGGDSSSWAVVDEFGLIYLLSLKTPDTSVITSRTLALMREYHVPAECVVFDRGGGGKEHADRLRTQGYAVRTVAFGEIVSLDPKRGPTYVAERMDVKEERYSYFNRRAQLYGELSQLLDPVNTRGFAIPAEYAELRRQMAPIPKTYDSEGRLRLLPKNKRSADSNEKTLHDLLGRSPDELDALTLAIFAMLNKPTRPRAGAV